MNDSLHVFGNTYVNIPTVPNMSPEITVIVVDVVAAMSLVLHPLLSH